MASKIDVYRAGAYDGSSARRTRAVGDDRNWQLCLARACRVLAAAERSALHGKEIQANEATA
jgi:hypothetical protein